MLGKEEISRSISPMDEQNADSSKNLSTNVTAEDVANLAGVSRWTVNRAFRKASSISEKSRSKVMEAAEQLGYFPDLQAASLSSGQSNLVSLLVDDFANPHKLVMMERLTRILRKHGWDSLIVNTIDEDDASAALMNASQRRVDAAILMGSRFNDKLLSTALGAQRVKKLILFARYSSDPNTISICCDDIQAMEEVTQHVLERGYKNPVFVAGPQTTSAHLMRKETFIQRWQEEKGMRPSHIVVDAYDADLAYQKVCDLLNSLERSDFPDVFVCENDALAMGAIDAIRHEFGLQTPRDIAVTGFDDVPQAANPHYNLTTYRQPLSDMVEALADVLKGKAAGSELEHFKGQLVIRDSA